MLLPHDITFLEALAMNYGLRIDIYFPKLNSNRNTWQDLNTTGMLQSNRPIQTLFYDHKKSAYLS